MAASEDHELCNAKLLCPIDFEDLEPLLRYSVRWTSAIYDEKGTAPCAVSLKYR